MGLTTTKAALTSPLITTACKFFVTYFFFGDNIITI